MVSFICSITNRFPWTRLGRDAITGADRSTRCSCFSRAPGASLRSAQSKIHNKPISDKRSHIRARQEVRQRNRNEPVGSQNKTPCADSGSTAVGNIINEHTWNMQIMTNSGRNDKINTFWVGQRHQASMTLYFWNASVGIWSHVEERETDRDIAPEKYCPSLVVCILLLTFSTNCPQIISGVFLQREIFEISGWSAASSDKIRRLCGGTNLLTWAVKWKAFLHRTCAAHAGGLSALVLIRFAHPELLTDSSAPKRITRIKPEWSVVARPNGSKFETRLPHVLSNKPRHVGSGLEDQFSR